MHRIYRVGEYETGEITCPWSKRWRRSEILSDQKTRSARKTDRSKTLNIDNATHGCEIVATWTSQELKSNPPQVPRFQIARKGIRSRWEVENETKFFFLADIVKRPCLKPRMLSDSIRTSTCSLLVQCCKHSLLQISKVWRWSHVLLYVLPGVSASGSPSNPRILQHRSLTCRRRRTWVFHEHFLYHISNMLSFFIDGAFVCLV